jgi:tetratricopeptide (TPR) repeat protein
MGSEAATRFSAELRTLYDRGGRPTLGRLVRLGRDAKIDISDATISSWLNGDSVPGDKSVDYVLSVLVPYLTREASERDGEWPVLPVSRWQTLLKEARDERDARRGGRPSRKPAVAARRTGVVTLPGRPDVFTGRVQPVTELLEGLDPVGGETAPAVVSAVDGMGGVGKTALAVHVAGAARDRGWFPGGILFEDLRGYSTGDPVAPDATAARLLRALGTPARDIPADEAGRLAAWRACLARLADESSPVLILLDNAVNAGQVLPLLPGPPHRILVTSRSALSVLPARRVAVPPFAPGEAQQYLDRALRAARPDDDRITTEPAHAQRLAHLCGHLPLALRIVVALLRDEPDRSLADQVAELVDARTRLTRLSYDDLDEQGRPLAVRAAFDLSYRRLAADGARARAFRLLAAIPGVDATTDVAAAAFGLEVADTRRLLAELARVHLLDKLPAGRWRMHDLVRLYAGERAREHAGEDDSAAAVGRIFAHYQRLLDSANTWLRAGRRRPVHVDGLASREDAVRWLDAEHRSLVAAISAGHESERWQLTCALSAKLIGYFEFRHQPDNAIAVATLWLSAARHLDQAHECEAAMMLGDAFRIAGRYDEAVGQLRSALALVADDDPAEGSIRHNLGLAYFRKGRYTEAAECHQRDLEICRRRGDLRGVVEAMVALGDARRGQRRFSEAVDLLNAAVRLAESLELPCVGNARLNLALTMLDGYPGTRAGFVIWQLCMALRTARDLDDRRHQALVFYNLSLAYLNRCRGCHGEAAAFWAHRAAVVLDELGDETHQAAALARRGLAQLVSGHVAAGHESLREATVLYERLGNDEGANEARALLAASAEAPEGAADPHAGCPEDRAGGSVQRREWLNDLPHAVLRRDDSRLDEATFVGNHMIGPTSDGSVLPDDLLAVNPLGSAYHGGDLPIDEAVEILRDGAGLDEDRNREIVFEVSSRRGALVQSAAIMRRRRLTSERFLELLRAIRLDGTLERSAHPRGALRVARLGLDLLERDCPAARPLLDLVAVVAPVPVERGQFLRAFAGGETAGAVQVMSELSLLPTDDDTVDPVIAFVVRDDARRRGALRSAGATMTRLLIEETVDRGSDIHDDRTMARICGQIDALWANAVSEPATVDLACAEDVVRLRAWRVDQLASAGGGDHAVASATALVDDCENLLGSTHPGTWHARHSLVNALYFAGDHDRACGLLAWSLRRHGGGSDDTYRLATQHLLAANHFAAGRQKRAITAFKEALAGRERVLGLDHPDATQTRLNLGLAYVQTGDHQEGIRLLEQVRSDHERHGVPSVVRYGFAMNGLADAYAATGRDDDAVGAMTELLTHVERTVPSDSQAIEVIRRRLAAFEAARAG